MSPLLLITLAALHQAGGQCAGTAWSSWYGDLVPADQRGRYFGRRGRFVQVGALLGVLLSGVLLQALEPGAAGLVEAGAGGAGFALVFGLAALARLASGVLLWLSPEPAFRGLPDLAQTRRFLGTRRGRRAWRLLAFGGALQFAVYTSSPYFAPFMLSELHFTYVEFMCSSFAVMGAKIWLMPMWGRAVDEHGPRSILAVVALLVALVPLPWVITDALWIALLAQVFSGFAWGGYEVAGFSFALGSTSKRVRPYYFATQNLLWGSGQLLGSLVGALLLGWLDRGWGLFFAISAGLRALLALAYPFWIPAERGRAARVPRARLLLRVVGFRPHGGLSHRPIEEPEGAPGPTEPR
jgi:MFS family permease